MNEIKEFINENLGEDLFFTQVDSLLLVQNRLTGKVNNSLYVGISHTIIVEQEERKIYRENNETGKTQKFNY